MSSKLKSMFFDSFCWAFLAGVLIFFLAPAIDRDSFDLKIAAFLTLAIFAMSFLLSAIVYRMRVRTLGIVIFAKPGSNSAVTKLFGSFWGAQFILVFGTMLVTGAISTDVNFYEFFDRKGIQGALYIFRGMTHPKWSILPDAILAIVQTIFTAFIATACAIPIAFVFSFFAAKNIMGQSRAGLLLYFSLRTILNFLRSIEAVSWAIIFSVWVGVGPFAGMLALFLHSVASLTKQYSEQIECVESGPIEGIQATGANFLQVIWFAMIPQVLLPFVSFTVYRWDINVRMATIVGLTGGGGIGTLLFQYQNQANWEAVGLLVIVIATVVWAMDTCSAYLREALK